jgi:hypothetical protein
MTKFIPDKKKKRPCVVDFFIETTITSNTASGIAELHKTTKFVCAECRTNVVDTKMAVLDPIVPTFVLYRKKYCTSCWLKLVL